MMTTKKTPETGTGRLLLLRGASPGGGNQRRGTGTGTRWQKRLSQESLSPISRNSPPDGQDVNGHQERLGQYVHSGTFQQDTLVAATDDPLAWEPQLVFHGFRYVLVSPSMPEGRVDAIQASFIHTELSRRSSITCSDADFTRLLHCADYSYRGNFIGFPSDCPQRKKRLDRRCLPGLRNRALQLPCHRTIQGVPGNPLRRPASQRPGARHRPHWRMGLQQPPRPGIGHGAVRNPLPHGTAQPQRRLPHGFHRANDTPPGIRDQPVHRPYLPLRPRRLVRPRQSGEPCRPTPGLNTLLRRNDANPRLHAKTCTRYTTGGILA